MKSSLNLPQIRCGSRSVSRVLSGTVIHLGRTSPHASSDLPGGRRGSRRAARKAQPASLFGLAPGGVYPAAPLTRNAVRSYRTFSPLPRAGCRQTRGGMFSVALSVDSRPPGDTWHPTLRSPDFPPCREALRLLRRGDCLIDSRNRSLCTLSRGCKLTAVHTPTALLHARGRVPAPARTSHCGSRRIFLPPSLPRSSGEPRP